MSRKKTKFFLLVLLFNQSFSLVAPEVPLSSSFQCAMRTVCKFVCRCSVERNQSDDSVASNHSVASNKKQDGNRYVLLGNDSGGESPSSDRDEGRDRSSKSLQ